MARINSFGKPLLSFWGGEAIAMLGTLAIWAGTTFIITELG
ncbi:unannotated protein [freshwater metagenome]|uniref:Unannotated protein n=1 Tax=freshwater metagenome TaxID=449393 RepID=A0A6J5Z821_9ZZZZ